MKVAYADPPYIGQAQKHYSDDPNCAEVNHAALIDRLEDRYDAWALSMSAAMYSVKMIVALAPRDARLAAWVKPFASFKPNVNPGYTWEPVLYRTKIDNTDRTRPTVKDHVIESITLKKELTGAKPDPFCFWLFELLGCYPDDDFHDLYPGTGIVTESWDAWCQMKRDDPKKLILDAEPELFA